MTTRERWLECLNKNKLQYPKEKRWRVEDKCHDKYFVVDGNTFAIDKDNTISGITRNKESEMTGSEILSMAVIRGGNKLQAFGKGLYEFYTKNAFVPVCTVKFDETKAPDGCCIKDTLVLYYYNGKKGKTPFDEFVKIAPEYENLKKAENFRKIIMGE